VSESFEKLQNRILSDARLKADSILNEAEEKASKIVEEARARARREADELIARAKLDAEALRRSILSTKVRANRLRLLDEKNKIIQSVMSSVEERLTSLGKSGDFQDSLKRMVTEAAAAIGSDEPIVHVGFPGVSKKDLDSIASALPKGAKLLIEDNPIDLLGGVIVSDPQGRVVFNNSFRARLDRMETQLLSMVSSTIFGE
jgi:V/A-type H+/Na+-transporting ATPase subunit E